jgi:hypothetical protein
MVLPGVQALFGFQLIAVFNASFSERLGAGEQRLHIAAIALVVIAIALVMAPAALHRQTSYRTVSHRFLVVSTHLLLWSMVPLALGICLDVYLVARLVVPAGATAAAIAGSLFVMIMVLWFVLPRSRSLQRLAGGVVGARPLARDLPASRRSPSR